MQVELDREGQFGWLQVRPAGSVAESYLVMCRLVCKYVCLIRSVSLSLSLDLCVCL